MNRLFFRQLMAGLLFWGWLLTAQAASVNTPDGAISFDIPDDFTTLDAEEIALEWPAASPPSFAVGNATRSTSIAYDLKQNPLPANDLPQAMKAFEGVFNRVIPGIDWKRRELIERAGHRWVLLEFGSNAVDTDIHNIMLITSYQGRMLTLNFNSTSGEFPKMAPALNRSIDSIAVHQP